MLINCTHQLIWVSVCFVDSFTSVMIFSDVTGLSLKGRSLNDVQAGAIEVVFKIYCL